VQSMGLGGRERGGRGGQTGAGRNGHDGPRGSVRRRRRRFYRETCDESRCENARVEVRLESSEKCSGSKEIGILLPTN
jgi:hypothetical protein